MNSSIEKIMSQVLELEGLLLVADNHNGEVNPIVFKMIHEKADAISILAQDITPASFNLPIEESTPPFIESAESNNEEQHPEEPAIDDMEFIDDEPQPDNEDEPAEDVVEDTVEDTVEEVVEIEPEPEPVAEEPEVFDVAEEQEAPAAEADVESDFDADTDNEDEDEKLEEEEFVDDEDVKDDSEENEEEDEEFVDEDEDFEEDDNEELNEEDDYADDDEQIKLDEALQRNISKNLNKAFSLNDRFRYRRELFENNEMELKNALDLVEAMHSYSEAEDYFYGDLDWDRDSEEVKDFMAIIRNHFL